MASERTQPACMQGSSHEDHCASGQGGAMLEANPKHQLTFPDEGFGHPIRRVKKHEAERVHL